MAEETRIQDDSIGPLAESDDQGEVLSEEYQAQKIASRLGIEYVDLENFEIDPELFRSIPVDLMFRYNFVPRHRTESGLEVVVSDPSDVLIGHGPVTTTSLATGAVIGSGSLRRRAQLLMIRPDLVMQDIRGNVDTRISSVGSTVMARTVPGKTQSQCLPASSVRQTP